MSGSIDVNLTSISNAINGATQFTGDAMLGLASQGSNVGNILGIAIVIAVVTGVLAALFGLIRIPLSFAHEFGAR